MIISLFCEMNFTMFSSDMFNPGQPLLLMLKRFAAQSQVKAQLKEALKSDVNGMPGPSRAF